MLDGAAREAEGVLLHQRRQLIAAKGLERIVGHAPDEVPAIVGQLRQRHRGFAHANLVGHMRSGQRTVAWGATGPEQP